MNHGVATFNNRFYAFGGKNSTGLVYSVEKYNPELNMWLVIKTNFDVNLGMVLCVGKTNGTENNVFITGGKNENGEESKSSTMLTFKPSDLSNKQIAPMQEKRVFPAIAYL